MSAEIQKTEQQISELIAKLHQLRKDAAPVEVKNYLFKDMNGEITLRELFGDRKILFAIHNMGQACRYCTLWADAFNAYVSHFEDQYAFVVLSKDKPEMQRRFANSRQWRFRMASHAGGDYIREQSVEKDRNNHPGMVCYLRDGDRILKKNAAGFGPGDLFAPIWHMLSLGGIGTEDWTPQYNYWQRPKEMDDGGQDLRP